MATYYSDLFPSRTSSSVGVAQRLEGWRKTPAYQPTWIQYTFVGDEVAGDVIRLVELNQGDRIIVKDCAAYVTVDPAVTLTLDIGDTATTVVSPFTANDVDRYADGINAAAVGLVSFGTAGVAYANPMEILDTTVWLTCTLATLATPAAGGVIKFYVPRIGA